MEDRLKKIPDSKLVFREFILKHIGIYNDHSWDGMLFAWICSYIMDKDIGVYSKIKSAGLNSWAGHGK